MRKTVLFAALGIACMFCSAALFATEIDKFTFLTESFPPYNFEESGLQGISVDILDNIFIMVQAKKTIPDIKMLPWARALKMATDNPDTVLFSTTRTAEREKLFKWVGPIASSKVVLLARKGSGIKINTIMDVSAYKVGTVRDDIAQTLLEEGGIDKDYINLVSSGDILVKMLDAGRFDLLAYNETVASWNMKRNNIDPSEFESVYILQNGELYFAINKDSTESAVKEFQQAFETFRKSPDYTSIIKKYSPGLR